MVQLKDGDYQLLREYKEMLVVMSEGFIYVKDNLSEEAPIQVQDVFNDLLASFQQLNATHGQLVRIFEESEEVEVLLSEYKEIVKSLTGWFEMNANQEKRELIETKVSPAFESWKQKMLDFIQPYTVQ
ncbi:hypothetical protein GCM10011351_21790 [Paraliobacillus quinghaiensis]|uniref:DUF8042 domain-containing protein n=1 Tax=Paraliobacillus quinghaiensis TaxID=470815 RepID=A0A917TSS6_9BACI|nr:hypothetical protein [Paraliobacillus quinghaiensis]GGM35381.1 hypothetical protein GCM10011351_21790 [Paraliobacillus quinghaiensis]